MTTEEEILKELKWQSKLIEAEFALLSELKFELLNSHKLPDITYTIPIPKKRGIIQTVHEKIQSLLKRE